MFLNTATGKNILPEYYKNHENLTSNHREYICIHSIKHYIESGQFMHNREFELITNQICSKFPNEDKVFINLIEYLLNWNVLYFQNIYIIQTFYFDNSGTKNTGRLYNKYKNSAAKLRKSNLFPKEKCFKKSPDEIDEEIYLELEPNENQSWLKYNTEPNFQKTTLKFWSKK